MNPARLTRMRFRTVPFLCLVVSLTGCNRGEAPAHEQPATLTNAVDEAALTRVTLTPEAEGRIGLETATVERRTVPRLRTVGGEVILRPGADVVITAPRAGTILPPADGHLPVTGGKVVAGDELARFVALPSESDLLGARQDAVIAQTRLQSARRRYERAQELFKLQAVTAQQLEDAEAEVLEAEAVLRSAEARVSTVAGAEGDTSAIPLALSAPIDALVTGIHVATGQRVSEGVPLISLEGIDPIWVRVPIYAGDLKAIDATAGAQIQNMGDPAGVGGRKARAVTGPPSANAGAATVDLYFQASNRDGGLRAGERVGVVLRLRDREIGQVVPWSAVVRDMAGGTWVYERTAPHVYTRHRVTLNYVVGDEALLSEGPPPGAIVVKTGAMELFSAEFGPASNPESVDVD